jgi:hypothetical protein
MPRRLFTLLSAFSLLLCLATAVLWARSYWAHDLVQHFRHTFNNLTWVQESYQYDSSNGGLSLNWGYSEFATPNPAEAAKLRQQSGYIYDNKYRTHWLYRPWGQYAGIDRKRENLWLGFGYKSLDTREYSFPQPLQVGRSIILPWAFPFLLFAALPAVHLRRLLLERRRIHRLTHNLCPTCAYDLRASKDRCPECGSPIPTKYE